MQEVELCLLPPLTNIPPLLPHPKIVRMRFRNSHISLQHKKKSWWIEIKFLLSIPINKTG